MTRIKRILYKWNFATSLRMDTNGLSDDPFAKIRCLGSKILETIRYIRVIRSSFSLSHSSREKPAISHAQRERWLIIILLFQETLGIFRLHNHLFDGIIVHAKGHHMAVGQRGRAFGRL